MLQLIERPHQCERPLPFLYRVRAPPLRDDTLFYTLEGRLERVVVEEALSSLPEPDGLLKLTWLPHSPSLAGCRAAISRRTSASIAARSACTAALSCARSISALCFSSIS